MPTAGIAEERWDGLCCGRGSSPGSVILSSPRAVPGRSDRGCCR